MKMKHQRVGDVWNINLLARDFRPACKTHFLSCSTLVNQMLAEYTVYISYQLFM